LNSLILHAIQLQTPELLPVRLASDLPVHEPFIDTPGGRTNSHPVI
jgi:hypothetical protein